MIDLPASDQDMQSTLRSYTYRLSKAQQRCEQAKAKLAEAENQLSAARLASSETEAAFEALALWKTEAKEAQTAIMQNRALAREKILKAELLEHQEAVESATSAVREAERVMKAVLLECEKIDLKLDLAKKAARKGKRIKDARAANRAAEDAISYRTAS